MSGRLTSLPAPSPKSANVGLFARQATLRAADVTRLAALDAGVNRWSTARRSRVSASSVISSGEAPPMTGKARPRQGKKILACGASLQRK